MKREELKALGLDDEAVEKVFALHGKSVGEIKSERDSYKNQVDDFETERKELNKQLKERSNELDNLKTDVEAGKDLADQIALLKQSHAEKEEQNKKQLNAVKLGYELDKSLDQYGVKNKNIVKRLINADDVKLSEEGNGVIGLDEQIKQLKETDDYLFNTTDSGNEGDQNGNGGSGQQDPPPFTGYVSSGQQGNGGQEVPEGQLGKQNAERLFKTQGGK